MIDLLATNFPGAFSGYTLDVIESHQKTKADTSGTAKAVVASMQQLGLDFDQVREGLCHHHHLSHGPQSQIKKVRQAAEQIQDMGVPEKHLGGHAFHTYTLTSPGGDVVFQFQHNVCGRTIYAEGTVDAALFLYKQVQAGSQTHIYNMIDVLKAGSMR